jgi:hypothetical protein
MTKTIKTVLAKVSKTHTDEMHNAVETVEKILRGDDTRPDQAQIADLIIKCAVITGVAQYLQRCAVVDEPSDLE